MTTAEVEPAWFNYEFQGAEVDCRLGCGPGSHPLYIGKSNEPLRRLLEHAKKQPWFGDVTSWAVFPERYATERQALAAETERIHERLPLANKAGNEGNAHRVEFVAAPARPMARRARDVAPSVRRVLPLSRRHRWSESQRVTAWCVGGAGLTVLFGWLMACTYGHVAVLAGFVASSAGVVAVLLACWALTFRKRSSARPFLLFCAGAAAVVGLWGLDGMPSAAPSHVHVPAPAQVQVTSR